MSDTITIPGNNIIRHFFILVADGVGKYRILSSLMCVQVQCAPEFHNDFWKKIIVISQE